MIASNSFSRNFKDKLKRFVLKASAAHLIIIILLVSFAVYFNTLFNDFVYDDSMQVLENQWIKDISYAPKIFISGVWSFQTESQIYNYYRPMMHLIYMLNYHIFGLKPWGFHLANILFHSSVSVLVFVIARRLLIWSQPSGYSHIFPAFVASILFAVHPIHTEAVAWVAGLAELSYAFFLLLSFYFYISSEEGKKGRYLLSVISFALATLCKEPAIVLPVILLAYDYVFKKEKQSYIGYFRRYAPYLVVTGAYLVLRLNALGGFAPQENIKLSTYGYIINVFPLFMKYLEKLILPVNLNAFHVFHPISSIFEPKGIISLAVTIAFVALTFISLKKNRMVFLSLIIIALPLLPALYISALGENVFTERYLYLPSFGFVMLIGQTFSWVQTKRLNMMTGLSMVFVIMAVVYSIGTVNRNAVWRDNLTLFTDTVMKSPDGVVPYYNLGHTYAELGRIDEAIIEYMAALKLKPDYANAHHNLGVAYAELGRIDEAIIEYKAALKLKPDLIVTRYNLGNTYAELGRIDEAIIEYMAALKLKPDYAEAHNNLGVAYEKKELFDEAVKHYQTALKLNPKDEIAKNNLKRMLQMKR